MRKIIFLTIALGYSILAGAVSGQSDPNNPLPEWVRRGDEERRRMESVTGKNENGMIDNRPDPRLARLPQTKPDGKPYTKKEIEEIEAIKKPSDADLLKNADFLKQSKTGIFRLFNYFDCEAKGLIRVDGECANYVPDSWSYSFRTKNYSDLTFFDIKFRDGNLITGSTLSLGALTSLGDVPIEKLSLTSEGIELFNSYKPETENTKYIAEMKKFDKGIEAGNYKYFTKIKAEANTTYGLRIVAYRLPNNIKLDLISEDVTNREIFKSYPLQMGDQRDDVIVVFRIIRKENDNLTILWKELKRENAPKLSFSKDVKVLTVKIKEN